MLIGEAEILGQVKDAYVQAQRSHTLGKSLHTLFRQAINAGKEARSRTAIAGDSTSIATAAVDAAKLHLGNLAGRRSWWWGPQDGRHRGAPSRSRPPRWR